MLEVASGGAWRYEDLDDGTALVAGPGRVLVVPGERRHVLRMRDGRPMRSAWHMLTLEDGAGSDALSRLPRAFVLSAPASSRAVRALAVLGRVPSTELAARVAYQRLGLELASLLLQHSPAPPAAAPGAFRGADGGRLSVRPRPPARADRPPRFGAAGAPVADAIPLRLRRRDGRPPMRYVLEQRVRMAQRLLLHSSRPCKEIGAACGFATPAHFARSFRRAAGVSPQAYRAQAR